MQSLFPWSPESCGGSEVQHDGGHQRSSLRLLQEGEPQDWGEGLGEEVIFGSFPEYGLYKKEETYFRKMETRS